MASYIGWQIVSHRAPVGREAATFPNGVPEYGDVFAGVNLSPFPNVYASAKTSAGKYGAEIAAARNAFLNADPSVYAAIDAYNKQQPIPVGFAVYFKQFYDYYQQGQATPPNLTVQTMLEAEKQWSTDAQNSPMMKTMQALAVIGAIYIAAGVVASAASGASLGEVGSASTTAAEVTGGGAALVEVAAPVVETGMTVGEVITTAGEVISAGTAVNGMVNKPQAKPPIAAPALTTAQLQAQALAQAQNSSKSAYVLGGAALLGLVFLKLAIL